MDIISGMLGNLFSLKGAIGVCGTLIFASRFLVQWIVSERRKESVVPFSFWILSIGGSLMLLTYSLMDHDPVVLLGHTMGIIVYSRNIILIRQQKRTISPAAYD